MKLLICIKDVAPFFHKGAELIKRGDKCRVIQHNRNSVLMYLVKQDGTETRFDVTAYDFKNCFQRARVRINYCGNTGMIAKNEAAKVIFWNNPNVVTMYIFKDT